MKNPIPMGFHSWIRKVGIKDDKPDLVVVLSNVPAAAAAVFTLNNVVGEPIKVGRKHVADGILQAFVVNSKNANVATGKIGYQDAIKMCQAVGFQFGIEPKNVLPSSTGVIGVRLPMAKIIGGIQTMSPQVSRSFDVKRVATAIMTTDMWPKYIVKKMGKATIAGVAKGAGMIEPNMATMLAYFVTDAKLPPVFLKQALKRAVERSFNCLTIDSDTSTSDTVAIMANGLANIVDEAFFENTLTEMCVYLSKEIARNGEGVTKLIEITVSEASSYRQAKIVAKSIANSPLVKTAIYGCDANWGRIVAAAGKCRQGIRPDRMRVYLGPKMVFRFGEPVPFSEEKIKRYLEGKRIKIQVNLGMGNAEARVWTGDLTEGYIKENASYRS